MRKCRICLKEKKDTTDIFKKTKSGMISTKIMSLTKLQIYPDDGLPNLICRSCNRRLKISIQFVELCETSDAELKKSFMTNRDIIMKDDRCLHTMSTCEDEYSKNVHIMKKENYYDETSSIQSEYLDLNSTDNDDEDLFIKSDKFDLNSADRGEEKLLRETKHNNLNNLDKKDKKSNKNQCFTCGKILSSKYRLKNHMACHSDKKPHACKYCDKKFSLSENLIVHLRTHTGEKPYSCPICQDSFTHYSNLIVHKRKHTGQTPFKCVLCPRSFRTLGHLQYHTRVHTGEKNYPCDKCGRAFITFSALKQHVVTHSGERSHVCSICGLRFTRSSNLKRHMFGSHKDHTATKTCKSSQIDQIRRRGERRSRNEIIN